MDGFWDSHGSFKLTLLLLSLSQQMVIRVMPNEIPVNIKAVSLSSHSTNTTPSNKATNRSCYYYQYIFFPPLTKGHLSNVVTVSWQIGWPY